MNVEFLSRGPKSSFQGLRQTRPASYLNAHNTNPTPFTWTKTADHIVEKVQRGRATLNAITS
jgi:hypothetical protein